MYTNNYIRDSYIDSDKRKKRFRIRTAILMALAASGLVLVIIRPDLAAPIIGTTSFVMSILGALARIARNAYSVSDVIYR